VTYECSLSPYPQAMAARLFSGHYADYRAHTDAVMAYNTAITFRAFRKMARAGLIEGDIPPYGCVAFPRVVGVKDTSALAAWLRDEHRVVVAPGVFFRAPGHIRVGFGGDSTRLVDSLARLGEGLAAYRAR
jgi:aspartate/methionine/tyrosine aminotransferase